MYGFHPVNLGIRFALELAALTAFGVGGYRLARGILGIVLAVVVPLVAAAVWGTFNVKDDRSRSGGAPVAVPGAVRLGIEAIFFGFATAVFLRVTPVLGVTLGTAVAVHYAFSLDRIRWLLDR